MRIFIFTDSKCVQPTMKTSIEETNVVSAFNEAYRFRQITFVDQLISKKQQWTGCIVQNLL